MMRCPLILAVVMTSMVLIGTDSADAESVRSAKAGGVYTLKPGIFVDGSIGCANPPNAAIKLYDGKGISTAHTRACRAKILSMRASGRSKIYKVSQSCIDAGSGPGKRFTEVQTVTVADAMTFTISSKGSTIYRYCPPSKLPAGLQTVPGN